MTDIAPPAPHRSRLKRWPFVLLTLLALATAVGALLHAKAEHIVLGAEGYTYGYPLVIMDVTRAHAAVTVGIRHGAQRPAL
jgi:hypothetical protein